MQFQLDDDELEVLTRNLDRQIQVLQDEVAHTEAHKMQHELARELEALERVRQKLRPRAGEPMSAVDGPML